MALYTRRQLLVLLLLVAGGGGGLAVGRWRRADPDTVDYLEQLEKGPAPPPSVVPLRAGVARGAARVRLRPAGGRLPRRGVRGCGGPWPAPPRPHAAHILSSRRF